MTEREMIEAAVNGQGFSVKSWVEDPDDGITGVLGRFQVIDEDEDRGIYDGDEGEVRACVVGSEKYRNQRVYFSFMTDGTDVGNELVDFSLVDPID